HLAVLAREKPWKLRKPRGSFCREDLNDRLGLRTAGQSSQCIEHWTVGFLGSVAFCALSVRDVNALLGNCDLPAEFLDQGRLADTRLPGDKHDLALAARGALPSLVQLLERSGPPDQCARGPSCGYDRAWGDRFGDRSDKPISALGHRLDKAGFLRAVPARAARAQDVFPPRLRLDYTIGPHRLEQLIVHHQPP